MADVISNALLGRIAEFVLGIDGTLPELELRLFVEDIPSLDCDTNFFDFDECEAGGYASVALVPGNWVGAVVSCLEGDVYPQITFTLTDAGDPAETIYGHYLVNTVTDDWWWAGLWTTPYVIPGGGGVVKVTLNWSDMKCSG